MSITVECGAHLHLVDNPSTTRGAYGKRAILRCFGSGYVINDISSIFLKFYEYVRQKARIYQQIRAY